MLLCALGRLHGVAELRPGYSMGRGIMRSVGRQIGGFALVVAALTGASNPAASVILIDDFNNPGGGQEICAGFCGATPSTSSLATAGVIGGERDMRVVRNSGGGRVDANANAFGLGDLVFGAVSAAGALVLQYDGADADPLVLNLGLGGGGGISVAGDTGIRYRISSLVDVDGTAQFTLLTSAGNFISFTDTIAAFTPAGDRQLPFASFAASGAFDPSTVRAIEVAIVGNTNLDLTVDFIETYRETVTVTIAAPSSVALFAGALVLIGLAAPLNGRRRARPA